MPMAVSDTYFLEVSARVSLKVATKDYFSQNNRSFSGISGILMPFSDTYFLKLSAHISLKGATKCSFRGNKNPKIKHC